MGPQRLRADLRRLPAPRRPRGRPARPAARVHGPASPCSPLALARLRPLELRGDADRRARRAGPRRGDPLPAALSIITTTFEEGSERNKALGIWGAMGGSGAAVGVLLGGDPDQVRSAGSGSSSSTCRSASSSSLLTRSIVRESRADAASPPLRRARRGPDHQRARRCSSSPSPQANHVGWGSAETIGVLAASAAAARAFIAVERRSKAPLVPLGIFARLRTLTGANVVSFLLGGLTFAMFFMLSLYMQQVLGLSRAADRRSATSPWP